jgi:general secretion pathway protein D
MYSVRNTDFSPRFPLANAGDSGTTSKSTQPFLFPGSDVAPDPQRERERDPNMRTASLQQAAFLKGDGVEMNFEGADVQTVAKALLGDILQLNFVVDPRVQGNVTLASSGPIPRKDVLPAFESVLRMSNAAIVRSGNLVKIVPIPEAGSGGAISVGAGEPGFGVSLVSAHTSACGTKTRKASSRPGAIRVVRPKLAGSRYNRGAGRRSVVATREFPG